MFLEFDLESSFSLRKMIIIIRGNEHKFYKQKTKNKIVIKRGLDFLSLNVFIFSLFRFVILVSPV